MNNQTIKISKSKLLNGDLLETMRFGFCYDREGFKSALKEIGLPIESEADLYQLRDWHNEELDVKNIIVNEKNENLKNFNIKDFVLWNITLLPNKQFCKIEYID